MEWQTIDTAPKDGTAVLVFADGKITTAYYEDIYAPGTWELCVPSEGYRDSDEVNPTHWMELPEAPNIGGKRNDDKE